MPEGCGTPPSPGSGSPEGFTGKLLPVVLLPMVAAVEDMPPAPATVAVVMSPPVVDPKVPVDALVEPTVPVLVLPVVPPTVAVVVPAPEVAVVVLVPVLDVCIRPPVVSGGLVVAPCVPSGSMSLVS